GLVDESEQRGDLRTDGMPGRLAEDGDEHVASGYAGQPRGVSQPNLDVAPGVLVHARTPADEGRQRNRGMIHQALADALKAHHDGNAHLLQVPDRTDAGAEQMGRGMDSPAGKNDLVAAKLLVAAVDLRLDTDA